MRHEPWNLGVLTTGCVVLGLVLGLLVGGFVAQPVVGETWLKTYQPMVGALLAITGAVLGFIVATRNMLHQKRIDLMGREEDRMEKALPGLRDAESFLRRLLADIHVGARHKPAKAAAELKRLGMNADTAAEAVVTMHLPRCDDATARQVVASLVMLFYTANRLDDFSERAHSAALLPDDNAHPDMAGRTQMIIEVHDGGVARAAEALDDAVAAAESSRGRLHKRAALYESRLPAFRARLEAYFAEHV